MARQNRRTRADAAASLTAVTRGAPLLVYRGEGARTASPPPPSLHRCADLRFVDTGAGGGGRGDGARKATPPPPPQRRCGDLLSVGARLGIYRGGHRRCLGKNSAAPLATSSARRFNLPPLYADDATLTAAALTATSCLGGVVIHLLGVRPKLCSASS